MKPQIVITMRGPNLSLRPPITMPSNPDEIMEMEKAPDVNALVQPKSDIIGLKKTPNEECAPTMLIWVKKAAMTMI